MSKGNSLVPIAATGRYSKGEYVNGADVLLFVKEWVLY